MHNLTDLGWIFKLTNFLGDNDLGQSQFSIENVLRTSPGLKIHPITSNANILYVSLHSFTGINSLRQVGQLSPFVTIPLFFNPDKTLGSRFTKLREYVAKTKNYYYLYIC